MPDKIRILDFINTAKSARELLAKRVTRVNTSGRFDNAICCGDGRYVDILRNSGLDVHVLDQPRNFNPIGIVRSIQRFRSILAENGITILHTHGTLVGAIGRIAAKLEGTPIVIHQVHGFHHHQHMAPWARQASIIVERVAAVWSDALLFQNAQDLEDCIECSIAPHTKLSVIGNGVDLEEFKFSPPQTANHRSFYVSPVLSQ